MSEVSTQTLLDEVNAAIRQVVNGARSVSVNGQSFHYTQLKELRAWRNELKIEVAEDAGTDGRGSWEAVFSD